MAQGKTLTPAGAPAAAQHPSTLEGTVERVVYANEETAWTVVRVSVRGRRELVTAVGNLPGVQPGESLRMRGAWAVDRRYGEQFRVESCLTITPATLVGIEKYLGSGLVRGIGKVMAERRGALGPSLSARADGRIALTLCIWPIVTAARQGSILACNHEHRRTHP